MGDISMITAAAWVPRGYAAEFPTKYEFTEEEYDRIADLAKLRLDDAKADLNGHEANAEATDDEDGVALNGMSNGAAKNKTLAGEDDDLKEYDLEHYDDSADGDEEGEGAGGGQSSGIFANIKSLVYHHEGEDDPYITLKEGQNDDDEDREDMQIFPSDNLVVAARIEDEIAHLEVYVYEDDADNLYVHHDVMLPAIPLCLEWLDLSLGTGSATGRGNSIAVGTMDPDIEIWDLDTVDCMYPNAILGLGPQETTGDGQPDKKSSKRKKKKKITKANDGYHVDAVLSLASNRQHRNLLASASADKTVKLWDLNTTRCAKSYAYHTDKVCSLAWHPQESTALLSGSYDKTVIAADMRASEAAQRKWTVESDIENVKWDPHDNNYFYVSTESGILHYFDSRVVPSATDGQSKSVWRLQAHDDSLSCFDINPHIPGYIVTGSADKQTKLWNVAAGSGPSMVVSRDLGVGRVFNASFGPDPEVGFRLAVAGSLGDLQIWDTSTNAAIRRAFAGRVPESVGRDQANGTNSQTEERFIRTADDGDDGSDDDADADDDNGNDYNEEMAEDGPE